MSGYHFHKDCVHFPDCEEEVIKKGKKEMILFKCPVGNGMKGNLYYKSELHTIKWTCTGFEEYQTRLELE